MIKKVYCEVPIIDVYDKNTGEFVGQYEGMYYASKCLGCHRQGIWAVLKGKNKYCHGYIFKYAEYERPDCHRKENEQCK